MRPGSGCCGAWPGSSSAPSGAGEHRLGRAGPVSTASPEPGLTERVKGVARALGFDAVGVAPAEPSERTRFLGEWLRRGYGGSMDFLARRAREREDPRRVLAGARSVVAVALVYDREPGAAGSEPGAIARYARGDDYHDVLGGRLRTPAGALAPL